METTKNTMQSIYPAVRYSDAKAGIAWLKSIGFEEHEVCPGEGESIAHAELKIAGNLIMLGSLKPGQRSDAGGTVYIAFETREQIDALYARAKAAGAEIVREICDTDYGSREFGLRDPEGHGWSFGTYRPQAAT